MRSSGLTFSVLAALFAGSALAQSPGPAPASPPASAPAQPSAGGTPDKVLFDIPYGAPIGLEQAQQLVSKAVDTAKQRGWTMNVTVLDSGDNLVAFARMDNAQLASILVSQRKAHTSLRFRRQTRLFYNAMETGHPYVATLDPELAASPGGFPLIANGKIVGAIGCSGGTGDQDATVCQSAADLIK